MDKSADALPARRAGDKGRYGRLSRERVLASALELVDRDGLSALSMRKLGAVLGVESMALYRYADSKEALLDGVAELLHAEVLKRVASAEPRADTRGELHRIARATYEVSIAHPNAMQLLATRILEVPLARRQPVILQTAETTLARLADAGLDDQQAARAYQAITSWTLGYTLTELQAMVDNPDEPDPSFRLGLHRMPAQQFPQLRAIAPALAQRGGPEGLAAGLDALLDRLLPPRRPPRTKPDERGTTHQ